MQQPNLQDGLHVSFQITLLMVLQPTSGENGRKQDQNYPEQTARNAHLPVSERKKDRSLGGIQVIKVDIDSRYTPHIRICELSD